jgi:putative phage-type endonuclease
MKLYAPETINGAKLLGVYTSGSPEWHSARENSIGGSEIGTILGLNPYESAYALWAKKTHKIETPKLSNWAIRFGNAFEEPILKLWEEEHPDWQLYTTGTYQDKDYDFIHVNLDALAQHKETGEWQIIEVKTARTTWDFIPPGYIAQVIHYMNVLGIHKASLVAVAGMTWNEFDIPWNEFQAQVQEDAILQFWASVVNDIRPDWDGSDSTYQAVRLEVGEIDYSEVELGLLGRELINAQQDADSAYKRLLKVKSEVMHKMGSAKFGVMTHQGESFRVASRQIRAGAPSLIVNKKGF